MIAQVGLDQFYHPVIQFAEDGANYRWIIGWQSLWWQQWQSLCNNYFCSINSGLPIINGCWLQEEVHIIIMLDVLYYYYNCHDHRHNNHFQLELMHSWGLTETHLAKAKHISDNYLKAHCMKYQLHWRQHSMLPVLHSWLIARRKICWGSWGRSLGWRTRSAWSLPSSSSSP